jgi:predicted  nucleic acid-binding Zn-ribbon protein
MSKNGANSGIEGGSQMTRHEEFLELCALSTSGALTSEERSRLKDHVELCSACAGALSDYQKIAGLGMLTLAPDFAAGVYVSRGQLPTESVKRALFERISLEPKSTGDVHPTSDWTRTISELCRRVWFEEWRVYVHSVAALLLVAALVASAYLLGRQGASTHSNSAEHFTARDDNTLRQSVSTLMQERQALEAQLRERDQAIGRLTRKINQQTLDIAKVQEHDKSLQDAVASAAEEKTQITKDRDDASQQRRLAQASLTRMQEELDHIRQERANDLLRAADVEVRTGELSRQLKDHEHTIEEQQQLLASDRDIRELMGARDLYIAEVYDVARTGQTQKPFGRVFFTKNKSLIFYAYDLDQQPGVSNASAFQAWGRRGPSLKQAVSLGIFYMDNAANKRWVLKVDDPKTLQQIEEVFVTVEPNGGSRKPSNNKLLFAYLQLQPNHP